jgi:adenine-specific DNA-methyltransferase
MNLIQDFNTKPFIEAVQSFFKKLNVPVNEIATVPASALDIIGENQLNILIKDVYVYGIVNDAIFEQNKTFKNLAEIKSLKTDYDGILIFGITLHPRENDLLPTRAQLADITRAFSRTFKFTPITIVFKYGNHIAFANTERTQFKQQWREGEKIGKVTLLRDIDINNVHSGHERILQNLAITRSGKNGINSYDALYKYWQEVLSVSILNKVFYNELSHWYFWAIKEVRFPNEPNQIELSLDDDAFDEALKEHKGKNVIRLLTRILFIWFIKEKGLIPEEIFDEKIIAEEFIDGFTPQKPEGMFANGKQSSKYYRAILQNLFFATLNQPQGKREYRTEGKHLNATQLMRYKSYLKNPEYFIQIMEDKVPFMNGGLFECLDKPDPTIKGPQGGDKIIYNDGFSDREDNELVVPDFLFFDSDEEVDLSKDYGNAKFKKSKTRGLFAILKSYKFTITENTPIDEEVALDPELLGKVFENLLASYNPETKTTARKQTGSFYTPREIVNYMVEESLITYLKNELLKEEAGILELGKSQVALFGNEVKISQLTIEQKIDESPFRGKESELDLLLHQLVSYSEINPFKEYKEVSKKIIKALDTCKILDPACGSGAYPMGILQKMVHILHKIDPNNTEWKQRQIDRVNNAIEELELINDVDIKDRSIKELKAQIIDIEASFSNNELDYGRKLYLIENCVYGVDIQPIAAQISKLRFFISLVVEQKVDATKENFGIRPLPNLETKFVAANTLIGIEKPKNNQASLFDRKEVQKLENDLKKVRHSLFSIKTPSIKRKLREQDKELREQISALLVEDYGNDTARLLANWDPYDQNSSSPFFDNEWMFDISDGFDIVIGNPPYVQLQKLNGSEMYSKLGFFTYSKSSDLYCLFYEKGIQLLNNGGNLNYITSNSWMRTKYGQALRTFFADKTNPIQLINFEDVQIFDSAVVESNIFITEKKPFEKVFQAVNLGSDFITGMDFKDYLIKKGVVLNELDNNGWILGDINVLDLKKKIEADSKKINELNLYIVRGFTTGCNEAFYINREIKTKIISEDSKSEEFINPILRGKDIKKWQYQFSDYYALTIRRNFVIDDYLSIKKHLISFKNKLDAKSGAAKWYELQANPSNDIINAFSIPKIIWGELSDKAKFTYDENSYFLDATVFLMTGDNLKYILSIFNSTLAQWYFEQIATSSGMGTNRWKKYKIEQFPIKVVSESRMESFESKVDIILNSKKENISSESVEREIDVMVYKLYELNYEEVLIIEPNFSSNKEDYERLKLE